MYGVEFSWHQILLIDSLQACTQKDCGWCKCGLYATCKIVTERICHTCVTYVTYHAFESCSNSFEFMYVTHVAYPFRDTNVPTEFLICIFLSS